MPAGATAATWLEVTALSVMVTGSVPPEKNPIVPRMPAPPVGAAMVASLPVMLVREIVVGPPESSAAAARTVVVARDHVDDEAVARDAGVSDREGEPGAGSTVRRRPRRARRAALERELRHRGQSLGRIVLGARAPGEPYAPGDLALVELLSSQLALALDAVALATQLQVSRGQIVTAREEERRRLRRDLHDGLGPALAGIALTLQAAENTGGPAADELVSGARAQLQDVVGEIRHIVHGLRPPILDDLGLAAAIRAHADHLAPLAVELDLPDLPIRVSAAAELAVYRIATAALTNVVRHAHAGTCRVALHGDRDETLLEVTDDGGGPDPDAAPGVGLRSMRERAAELGGQIVLSQASQGGLAVAVRLPNASQPQT